MNDRIFAKALKSFPVIDTSELDTIEFTMMKYETDDDSDLYGLGFTFYSNLSDRGNSGMTIALGVYTQTIDEMKSKIKDILATGIFDGCHNLSGIAPLFDEAEETIEQIDLQEIFESLGYDAAE